MYRQKKHTHTHTKDQTNFIHQLLCYFSSILFALGIVLQQEKCQNRWGFREENGQRDDN